MKIIQIKSMPEPKIIKELKEFPMEYVAFKEEYNANYYLRLSAGENEDSTLQKQKL